MNRVKIVLIFMLTCILTGIIWITVGKLSDISHIDAMVKENSSKKFKIGVSMGTLKEERWLKDREQLKKNIADLGGEVIIKNANNDDEDQIQQVKGLLKQDIDVLILVPNDHTKAQEAVRLAKNAGVKVISYDRLVLKSGADIYISFDNESVGKKMAEAVVEDIGRGRVLLINGDPSDNNTKFIRKGYMSVLVEEIKKGNIEIVEEIWAEDWMQEVAFQKTGELLIDGEKIDAIISGNDSLAGGAIRALAEKRMAGEVYVTGQDADLDACQRIVEGTQGMTVYKPVDDMSKAAAELAMKLAEGTELEIEEKIYDGKYFVTYYSIDVERVHKDNMNSVIIQGNFHKKEDVYR